MRNLVKDPYKIVRLGQPKAHYCDCGTITWEERCRKCRRKYQTQLRRNRERLAAERNMKSAERT